jgi:hypothetical protein
MQDAPKFEIHVPGFYGSVDEARQAKGMPVSELPPISEEEHAIARKFEMSDEDYRREKLVEIFGRQRMEARAIALGKQVEEILSALEPGYRLASVTWNFDTSSWRLGIETPQEKQNVVLSWELVADAMDSQTRSELQRLRNMVLFGLGRRDLIFEKRQ